MYEVTRLIDVSPLDEPTLDVVAARIAAAADATGAEIALVSPTLPGVRNGGHLVAHLQFDSEDRWIESRAVFDRATSQEPVVRVNSVEYHGSPHRPGAVGRRAMGNPGAVYRTLLLRVDDSATTDEVDRFERALLRMPRYVDAIQAWRLSRVAVAGGDSQWTHVWEQEYADVDGLLGPYMNHPIHWASVDPFFDPENPVCLVTDRVCHSFCTTDRPLIEPASRPTESAQV
ncbi:Dabb family protein [Gordonia paraffinivorans]|uniref:Dabb family protein n=1 Tax=Gordonia paraffinivorans TaxID=175628 RepID=UPI001444BB8A|nr:Dabb family protein [Gordonia paraffinivorans]